MPSQHFSKVFWKTPFPPQTKAKTYSKKASGSGAGRKPDDKNEDSGEDSDLPQTPKVSAGLTLQAIPGKAADAIADGIDELLISALANEILLQSRNVDWYDISLGLCKKGFVKANEEGKKARKGTHREWQGDELREIFRQRLLPSLQKGKEVFTPPTVQADLPTPGLSASSPLVSISNRPAPFPVSENRSHSPEMIPQVFKAAKVPAKSATVAVKETAATISPSLQDDADDEFGDVPDFSAVDFDQLDEAVVKTGHAAPAASSAAAKIDVVAPVTGAARRAAVVKSLPNKPAGRSTPGQSMPDETPPAEETSRARRKRALVNYANLDVDTASEGTDEGETWCEEDDDVHEPSAAKKAKVSKRASSISKQPTVSPTEPKIARRSGLATKAAPKPPANTTKAKTLHGSESDEVEEGKASPKQEKEFKSLPVKKHLAETSVATSAREEDDLVDEPVNAKKEKVALRHRAPRKTFTKMPVKADSDGDDYDAEDGLLADEKAIPRMKPKKVMAKTARGGALVAKARY